MPRSMQTVSSSPARSLPCPAASAARSDPDTVPRLLAKLSELAIDRHSFAIAIGGGAVLDAVGYAATIFHRGVRHIRFPTTVLAQDDSGVGVKNAVNSLDLKNLVGTFAPPWAIINDSAFIDRLPPREKRAGMAEAVKVALIRDGNFFRWIESNTAALAQFSPRHLGRLIKDCAELHMRQIRLGGDPFEAGIGASAGFRALVRAQTRVSLAARPQSWRGGCDRHRARYPVFCHGWIARRRRGPPRARCFEAIGFYVVA